MTYNKTAEKRKFLKKALTKLTKLGNKMSQPLTKIQKRQEAARKLKAEVSEKLGKRERVTKIEDGTSKWRILPSWTGDDEGAIARTFGQHFVKDANGDLKAVHMCLDKTYGKDCPICNAVNSAIRNSTSDDMTKILNESKPSSRFLVNALHIDGKEPGKVVILELAPTCFEQISDLMYSYLNPDDEDEEPIDILDTDNGLNLEITRSGKGIGTKYKVLPVRKTSKINPDILDDLFNLDDYVKQEHAETQTKALGVVETVVTGRLPAPAKEASRSFAADDDDDILEGDFEDDEPFGEPAPKAKAKSASKPTKKAVSDDEIDDLLGDLDDLDLDD